MLRFLSRVISATLITLGLAFSLASPLGTGKATARFKDISGHWAEAQVTHLLDLGIITGYEDGTFRPENPVTREEFVALLARAIRLQLSGSSVTQAFQDVTPTRWSYPYVQAAVKAGLIQTSDYGSRFQPAQPISRGEIAAMLVRAAGAEPPGAVSLRPTSIPDVPSDKVANYVAAALSRGLLAGYPDGSFRPTASTTRAEAATTVARLLSVERRPQGWSEQYTAFPGSPGSAQLWVVRTNLNRGNWSVRWVPPSKAQGPGVRTALVAVPGDSTQLSVSSPAEASQVLAALSTSGVAILSSGKPLQLSTAKSSLKLRRSAVGTTAEGFLVFAVTSSMTSHELSLTMFELGCRDAVELPADETSCLYLDGSPILVAPSPAATAYALVVMEKTPILGPPQATVEQAQRWAASRNATATFVSLAPLYWQLAVQAGIRPEIAYCQAAKETNFGKFTGVVPEYFHNPCGLKTRSGGSDSDRAAHQQFRNWEEGVKAHVDHLALYAGAPGYPKAETSDPRHFPKLFATVKFVEDLGGTGRWAPSPDYGYSIRLDYLAELLTQSLPASR
ncbi:MAG: S-layer homology domain-containing protein [Bacillota bacterium]